ncbi:MAG TPA: hypothetical protein VJM48_01845 [Methylibium sp.]|nr:hypothetical protein [Methylibium sp.]
MNPIAVLSRYFAELPNGRIVLWCYLIWYLVTLAHHFDPAPAIWLNSAGLAVLIGVALLLSTGGLKRAAADKWQTFRLFAMPLCVSSFAALIKGKGFVLVLPPSATELAQSVGACALFTAAVLMLRWRRRRALADNRADPTPAGGAR